MFQTIEKSENKLSFQHELVRKAMIEHENTLKAIDENKAMIEEAEALSTLLIATAMLGCTGSPVFVASLERPCAWVQIGWQKLSTVRSAINAAGLHIFNEVPKYAFDSLIGEPRVTEMEFTLVGYDCPVIALEIAPESSGADDIKQAA